MCLYAYDGPPRRTLRRGARQDLAAGEAMGGDEPIPTRACSYFQLFTLQPAKLDAT